MRQWSKTNKNGKEEIPDSTVLEEGGISKDVDKAPIEQKGWSSMVTRDMHQQLADLGYPKEIREKLKLSPQTAWDILNSGRCYKDYKEKMEGEKLFQYQIENNSHPRATNIKKDIAPFIDAVDRHKSCNDPADSFQSLKEELSEILYRNDIEYAENKDIKINGKDKEIIQPILDFRKELDAPNIATDPRAMAEYKTRILKYMENTFGVESYSPKEGDAYTFKDKGIRVTKVDETVVSDLDRRIKKVVRPGYKINDKLFEDYKKWLIEKRNEMSEKWKSIKGTVSEEEFNKTVDEDNAWIKEHSFTGQIRPADVEMYKYGVPVGTTEKPVDDSASKADVTEKMIIEGKKELNERKTREKVGDQKNEIGEEVEENITKIEGTPKEWREKLSGLVGRFTENAKEKLGMSERGEQLKLNLENRSSELDGEAKKLGMEGTFRKMGEWYNKLNWKTKLAVGGALGVGLFVSSIGASIPAAAGLIAFGSGLAIQRAYGMASMFLKFEKGLQNAQEGTAKGFISKRGWVKGLANMEGKKGKLEWSKKETAMLMAGLYSAGFGAAISGAVRFASDTEMGHHVHDWLGKNWPFGGAKTPESASSESAMFPKGVPVTAENTASFENPLSKIIPHSATNVPFPEPSVGASTGHGYEYMAKRLAEQLHMRHLNPKDYAEGSDIRQLLEAKSDEIDSVVHKIASDSKHGFFHDGASVRIDPKAQMTIGADGQIHLDNVAKVPEHVPTKIPQYHPKAPAPVSTVEPKPIIESQPKPIFKPAVNLPGGKVGFIDNGVITQPEAPKISVAEATPSAPSPTEVNPAIGPSVGDATPVHAEAPAVAHPEVPSAAHSIDNGIIQSHEIGGNKVYEFAANDKDFNGKITITDPINGGDPKIVFSGPSRIDGKYALTDDWEEHLKKIGNKPNARAMAIRTVEIESRTLAIDERTLGYLNSHNLGDSEAAKILKKSIQARINTNDKLYGPGVFKKIGDINSPVKTPGAVISEGLSKALNTPAAPGAPQIFTGVDHSPIDVKIPAIYEAHSATGEPYLVAYGGTDESRFNFMQKFLSDPANQGKSIRWAHTVTSKDGPKVLVDEIGAQTSGGRISWLPSFFAKQPELPDPKNFDKLITNK